MKTIKFKQNGNKCKAIIKARDWFGFFGSKIIATEYLDYYCVVTYLQYDDKTIEAKTTEAIVKNLDNAEVIFALINILDKEE